MKAYICKYGKLHFSAKCDCNKDKGDKRKIFVSKPATLVIPDYMKSSFSPGVYYVEPGFDEHGNFILTLVEKKK